MMRGISYDDNYIARKMNTFDPISSYGTHVSPYGSYGQENGLYGTGDDARIGRDDPLELTSENISPPIGRPGFTPSARTQLILNRVALSQPRGYSPAPRGYLPRMGPPPPTYYDYDYGYGPSNYGGYGGYGYRPQGCGYGYGYPPPPPLQRYRNLDSYMEDDYDMNYVPRYRPSRLSDAIVELEKEKHGRSVSPVVTRISTTTSTALPPTDYLAKHFSPGMLHDQVDKMRTRLQAMSYSLDPPGQNMELAYPEKSRFDAGKKYSSGLEMADLPRLSNRRSYIYPEDHYMKDNFRIKCLSHYKTTRSAAEYWKPKLKYGDDGTPALPLPTYTSKLSSGRAGDDSSKWEEPGTVYSRPSDTKPFSKVETGSSLFSTYGYTNCKRDAIADKVRDYYYSRDENKPGTSSVKFDHYTRTKASEGDEDDQKKERRRKKKSKEREEPPLPIESSEGAGISQIDSSGPVENGTVAEVDAELDEKEKKRLEKKKKKAEREAAAKAAMEAELAALAEAEAELARLEAESAGVKAPQELKTESSVLSPAASEVTETKTEPEPEAVTSEEVVEKCESPQDTPITSPSDCLPPTTESECQPSILSSNEPYVPEESLQDHVEASTEVVLENQPESEPEEQVTESILKSSTTDESVAQLDAAAEGTQMQMKDGEPTFRSEAVIWDDSNDVADNAAGDESLVSATGAGDDSQTGETEENNIQPQESQVVDEEPIKREESEEVCQEPVIEESVEVCQEPALGEPQENELPEDAVVQEADTTELEPVDDFWSNEEEKGQGKSTDAIDGQQKTENIDSETVAQEIPQEEDQTEQEMTQVEETEELVDKSQEVDQEAPVEEEPEEPNLDDVPLETDVDIFAGRED